MNKEARIEALAEALAEVDEHLAANPLESDGSERGAHGYRIDADLLEGAGEALFGRRWKTEMADIMGWKDASRVRAMMSGKRPVPLAATASLVGLLEARIAMCRDVLDEIEEAGPEAMAAE